ncbi:MAG: transcriptional antiterminator, partial [Tetragenococcus koreensis]|nr:transcriptional antiterminator [Tetragenococcus koreensis]
MEITEEAKEIIENSLYQNELRKIIEYTDDQLVSNDISLSGIQWTVLINHLKEMIDRKKEGASIPEVDSAMFSEVSSDSLLIADNIVKNIG